jgi:xylan 1,4-beta-xylosidase
MSESPGAAGGAPPSYTPHDPTVRPSIESATVRVDLGRVIGPLERIWTSFGYDEFNWTYTPAGKRNLRTIGEFVERPYFVRPHYVFNSGIGWSLPHWGAGNVYHEDSQGRPFYDFSLVDQAYDAIVNAGLVPLVELGFTPRSLVAPEAEAAFAFERSPTQWSPYEAGLWATPPRDYEKWGGLVRTLVEHCAKRYGADAVRGWLWECWNEPDIVYWRGTPEQFYALYDVTAAAVKRGLDGARVGGPTTTGDMGPGRNGNQFLRGFLEHCARHDTPLDFVSFHTKGARFDPWRVYGPTGGPPPERQSPSSLKMLREVRASLRAVAEWPRFRDLPCIVDECDASVPAHWGTYDNANFEYRNTEYYPVFQCKLMKKLLDLNDTGLARVHQATTWSFYFEGERYFEGTRALFTANGVEKPVLNAYRLLARLGHVRVQAESDRAWGLDGLDGRAAGMREEVDALAAWNGSDRLGVVVWRHVDDQYAASDSTATIDVIVDGLPAQSRAIRVRHWRIDANHSNSHTAWLAAGAPQDPSEGQIAAIKARQRLELFEPDRIVDTTAGRVSIRVALPLPSVSLLEFEPA